MHGVSKVKTLADDVQRLGETLVKLHLSGISVEKPHKCRYLTYTCAVLPYFSYTLRICFFQNLHLCGFDLISSVFIFTYTCANNYTSGDLHCCGILHLCGKLHLCGFSTFLRIYPTPVRFSFTYTPRGGKPFFAYLFARSIHLKD